MGDSQPERPMTYMAPVWMRLLVPQRLSQPGPAPMDGHNSQDRPNSESRQFEEDTTHPNGNSSAVKRWTPARFLSSKARDVQPENPYAVIILNQPIDNKDLLVEVCRGGNAPLVQLFQTYATNNETSNLQSLRRWRRKPLKRRRPERRGRTPMRTSQSTPRPKAPSLTASKRPDVICGDLDSLLPEVEAHYKAQGTRIIKDPDQYSTDFTKCLKHISGRDYRTQDSSPSGRQPLDVAVIGGLGGRADQAFSQIHHLYAASQDTTLASGDVYLLTGESAVFLLHKGRNVIRTPLGPVLLAENVGIIPIARPAIITTRGLEWDVEDWPTEFGTQVSTSNHVRSEVVEVETTEKVLFTIELAQKPTK